MISELYSSGEHREFTKNCEFGNQGCFAFTAAASAGLIFLGPYLLGLFGEDFGMSYLPMVILIVGMAVNGMTGPAGFLMTMTKHQKEASFILTVSALLNVVLNILLYSQVWVGGCRRRHRRHDRTVEPCNARFRAASAKDKHDYFYERSVDERV